MMIKENLVNKIKTYFGLNIYETKVWLALLEKGSASAGEIADISGVPRSRTYDVLEALEKQGFAVQKIGKPIKYLAVKPFSVIDKLKKSAMEDMEEKINVLSTIKETQEYRELESLHSSTDKVIKNHDISGTIRGKLNINSQINDVMNLAKKEVIVCTSTDEFKKRKRLLEPMIKKLNESGIKLIVCLKGDESDISELNKKFDIKAKKIDIDASFYIADRQEILFMLNKYDEDQEQWGVWFSSPFFVESFAGLFDLALKKK
jgi:HTH-type transcriptional regulator, sugar sensing transcriptional regulator